MITSVKNELIKSTANLLQKKYRCEYGRFLAQGIRIVADACLIDFDLVQSIFISEKGEAELYQFMENNSPKFDEIYVKIKQKFIYVNETVIKKLSLSQSAQEVIAVISMKNETNPTDFVLYLDRIRDPGNLGTIIRTANACGYSLILDNCVDIYSPKVVQSSMSGIISVDFSFGTIDSLSQLKQKGYNIYCADLDGENLFDIKPKTPLCVVIGNEANGINPKICNEFGNKITIPMQAGESLNASISASIIMYQLKYYNRR